MNIDIDDILISYRTVSISTSRSKHSGTSKRASGSGYP